MSTYDTDLAAQDKIIKEIKDEIQKLKKELEEAKVRRNEIARNKIKVGDHVELLTDINDAYGETYLSKGTIVNIIDLNPKQVGYEYCIPYGFCIGRDDFKKSLKKLTKGVE